MCTHVRFVIAKHFAMLVSQPGCSSIFPLNDLLKKKPLKPDVWKPKQSLNTQNIILSSSCFYT